VPAEAPYPIFRNANQIASPAGSQKITAGDHTLRFLCYNLHLQLVAATRAPCADPLLAHSHQTPADTLLLLTFCLNYTNPGFITMQNMCNFQVEVSFFKVTRSVNLRLEFTDREQFTILQYCDTSTVCEYVFGLAFEARSSTNIK
jgi:hypothetical protein